MMPEPLTTAGSSAEPSVCAHGLSMASHSAVRCVMGGANFDVGGHINKK